MFREGWDLLLILFTFVSLAPRTVPGSVLHRSSYLLSYLILTVSTWSIKKPSVAQLVNDRAEISSQALLTQKVIHVLLWNDP